MPGRAEGPQIDERAELGGAAGRIRSAGQRGVAPGLRSTLTSPTCASEATLAFGRRGQAAFSLADTRPPPVQASPVPPTDPVDEADEETFPASDAPSFTG